MLEAVFWGHAVIAIVSALLCITRRSPVASALWLIMTLFATAVMFLLLDAHFIAALQVLVYSGAIMVLFLFVIMLLNLGDQSATHMKMMIALRLISTPSTPIENRIAETPRAGPSSIQTLRFARTTAPAIAASKRIAVSRKGSR